RHTRSIRDWSSDVCSSDLDLDGAEAGRAAARTIGLALVVEHQIPQQHAAAHAAQRPEEDRLEVVHQTFVERVVPLSDRSLREVEIGRASCRDSRRLSGEYG